MKSNVNVEVIIIGAGPSGISSAIYLARAGIKSCIIEKGTPGGTLNKISKIENYPGYLSGVGTDLAMNMYEQIINLKIPIIQDEVTNIKESKAAFNVFTKQGKYSCKYLIIATGKSPKKLDIENADKFEGKGISYCAICDGALYKRKNVAVVGGGNSAIMTANYLKDICNKVYIINRSGSLRADTNSENQISKYDNIEIMYDSKITKLLEKENFLSGIEINNNKKILIDGLFICIGQKSNCLYYNDLNLKSNKIGIIVDNNMKSSNDRVYACGDAISKNLYQVVTAVSEGAIAAVSITKKIRG